MSSVTAHYVEMARMLDSDQRKLLVALADSGPRTFDELAGALGWSRKRVVDVSRSLPPNSTFLSIKTIHQEGRGLMGPGRIMAEAAKLIERPQLAVLDT